MDPDTVLGGLDDDQRRAATSPAMPLAVIAPAGSGKTRVLTARVAHRIATGDVEPAHVLCVTFTRKAASELRSRLRASGIHDRIEAGTFHAVALRMLQDRWAASGRAAPRMIDRVHPFLRDQVLPDAKPSDVSDLATEISWARARLVRPSDYEEIARRSGRRARRPAAWVADRYAAYERAKSDRHVVDFDDLLAACQRAIEGDPAFAAAQRWRFRHLFVDEFQDVNPLQFALLEAWRGDRWDVFVVGDPHQSIYGWNGADPRLLDGLSARWPAVEVMHLDRTHRSSPQVTSAAASVIRAANLPDRHPRASGPPGPPARLREHEDEVAQLTHLATAIRRRRGPDAPWAAFAVLARTHDQVLEAERGLASFGIPVVVRRSSTRLDDEGDGDGQDADHPISDRTADGREDAVTISTIHAAKGLEWPVVHIIGCEDGSIPHVSARRRTERDEEARLLYVAITRAAREVEIHWARERTIRGIRRERQRSPFLERFDDGARADLDVAEDPVRRLAELRRELTTPQEPDPLVAALRAWRDGRARAARTAPDVVLDDWTIDAIVEARPASVDDLAAIPGIGTVRAGRFAPELLPLIGAAGVGA